MVHILHVVGCKDAGKTRACEVLIPPLQALGLAVGTLKHTEHEGFEWDVPGKDTDRHRRAGSAVTGIFGGQRFAFSFNRLHGAEVPFDDLIRTFYGGLDLILVEGYQRDPSLRLEVCRPDFSTVPISPPQALLATYGAELFGYRGCHFDYGKEAELARYVRDNLVRLRAV